MSNFRQTTDVKFELEAILNLSLVCILFRADFWYRWHGHWAATYCIKFQDTILEIEGS